MEGLVVAVGDGCWPPASPQGLVSDVDDDYYDEEEGVVECDDGRGETTT